MARSPRSARLASRTSYIGLLGFDRGEHVLGRSHCIWVSPMIDDGDGVVQVLERLLQRIPPVDRHQHSRGSAAVGDDERVVTEVGELVTDAIAKVGLGDDACCHPTTVRLNVRLGN